MANLFRWVGLVQDGALPVVSRVITPGKPIYKAIYRGYNSIYNWEGKVDNLTTISGFIPSCTHLQPWFFIGLAGVITTL